MKPLHPYPRNSIPYLFELQLSRDLHSLYYAV